MTHLIEHLAELTGIRDRDLLDVTVVRAMKDVLQPVSVGIYRRVGEPDGEHWITRALISAGQNTPTADPMWSELATLPQLEDAPARRACLLDGVPATVQRAGHEWSMFPIVTEREVIGVLEIETRAPLSQADGAMVATILRIYGNFLDLLDHSERDPLTGLLNRQTFNAAPIRRVVESAPAADPTLKNRNRRSRGAELCTWLGVVDIDHFKRVNDQFGHPIGDEVLLLISRLMRSSFRFRDRLYRFGGEEFVVVIDCVSAQEAAHAFERLRSNVEQFVFPQVQHLTVSIGFTRTHADESLTAGFPRADKALYYAKDNGRNQVAHFEQLVTAGLLVEAKIAGDVELF